MSDEPASTYALPDGPHLLGIFKSGRVMVVHPDGKRETIWPRKLLPITEE